MQEDKREGPSEFVFSEEQKRRSWPKKFWAQLVRRIEDGELTIDPRELARRFRQLVPGMRERRSPGRPPGGPFRDREDFEARLIEIVSYMNKYSYTITKEAIACTLRILLEEPQRRDHFSRVVSEATRSRQHAKAARENLRRWCDDYQVDLDHLIRQVTRK